MKITYTHVGLASQNTKEVSKIERGLEKTH